MLRRIHTGSKEDMAAVEVSMKVEVSAVDLAVAIFSVLCEIS